MRIDFAPAELPRAGTLVVLAAAGGALGPSAAEVDRRSGGAVSRAIEMAGDAFKRGQAIELLYPAGLELERLVVLGVGKPEEASRFDLEALGGSLAVKLKGLRVGEASLAVDAPEGLALGPAEIAVCLASGACLRSYRFDKYRTQKDKDEDAAEEVAGLTFLLAAPQAARDAWAQAEAVTLAVAHARDLVAEPANVLSPERFADECRKLGDALGLEVEVLGPAELRDLGMRALLGVAQGSAREPRVVVMRWSGGAPAAPPVGLIGKGVCFDSGGLSLKPPGGMEEMKWDMGGAGAVFGAMEALARRRAKANVVGVLGLTENMPSGTAQRPGDVVTSMAGITIEVINTDAEGRLVLADVLHYTKDRLKPRLMIDLATLTGAIIIALGHEQAGPVHARRRPRRADHRGRRRGRREGLADAARRRLRQAHQVRDRRHQERRPGARGRCDRGGGIPAKVRGRRPLGAPRHRGRRLVEAGPAARRQGCHRLRRPPARSPDRRSVRELSRPRRGDAWSNSPSISCSAPRSSRRSGAFWKRFWPAASGRSCAPPRPSGSRR